VISPQNRPQTHAMTEVYVVNLIQINPLRRAVGVGLLAVGYVVVIDLPVQLAVSKVQLD
jgi:hypothetical protein